MKKRKWGFFPYDMTAYKAAQAYLDKKAAKGWVLDKLVLGSFARFVPAEGRVHAVDFDPLSAFDGGPDEDYLNLCADAGWELVKNKQRMLLFRSLPGVTPTPLQTDEGMEAERFWKKCIRRNLIWTVILLIWLYGMLLLSTEMSLVTTSPSKEFFCANAGTAAMLLFALAAVYMIWEVASYLVTWLRLRTQRRMPQQKGAWVRGILSRVLVALLVFYYILDFAEIGGLGKTVDVAWTNFGDEYTATVELCASYPVICAGDLGLEPSSSSRYLDGHRTLWVDWLDYSEITPGEEGAHHILTTERYQCISEPMAEWFFDQRREETANGSGFLWGKLEWESVGSKYGFDEICFAREDSYLLARDGSVVILVGASGLDLTDYMSTIRARLELE